MNTKVNIPDLIDNKGKTATTDHDKAEMLVNFFTNVFTKENTENVPTFKNKSYHNILSNIEIKTEEVRKKLSNLNPCKSAGPDGIHSRILKELSDELALPLSIIYSKSLKEGNPKGWKDAEIHAKHKKDRKDEPGNYRPISLTSIVCKIMESIIRDRILNHLTENNLTNERQHGFVPGKSCFTNLLNIMDAWTKAIDNRMNIDNLLRILQSF